MFAEIAHQKIIFRVSFGLPCNQHMQSGKYDERAERVQYPVEALDQFRASGNHQTTHHQRAQNSISQHSLLVLLLHRENPEHHQEHKQVVHAQRLFDHVAREKFQPCLPSVKTPDPPSKRGRQPDPNQAPAQRFSPAYFV